MKKLLEVAAIVGLSLGALALAGLVGSRPAPGAETACLSPQAVALRVTMDFPAAHAEAQIRGVPARKIAEAAHFSEAASVETLEPFNMGNGEEVVIFFTAGGCAMTVGGVPSPDMDHVLAVGTSVDRWHGLVLTLGAGA